MSVVSVFIVGLSYEARDILSYPTLASGFGPTLEIRSGIQWRAIERGSEDVPKTSSPDLTPLWRRSSEEEATTTANGSSLVSSLPLVERSRP